MRTSLFFLILFALAGVGLTGCDSSGARSEDTSIRILLTDAPGDLTSAVVTIDAVYLQGAEGEGGGRVILREDPVTVDLLTLQNEVLDLVDDEPIPAGTYAELRLVISGGYIAVEQAEGPDLIYASSGAYADEQGVTADGRLQMPSYGESGLKIVLPGITEGGSVLLEGEQYVLLLDFVVAESFGHQAGQSGMWVMHPVIHATELGLTGSVEVTLALDEGVELPEAGQTLADFTAQLDVDGDLHEVAFSDVEGTFLASFPNLEPGTYDLDLVAPEGVVVTTDVGLPLAVTVESGLTAAETLVITAAVPE